MRRRADYSEAVLFDIGVAGPLASFILSVPCLFFGMKLSTVVTTTAGTNEFRLGEPLLLKLIQWITVGELQEQRSKNFNPAEEE